MAKFTQQLASKILNKIANQTKKQIGLEMWSNPYNSWEEVELLTTGYHQDNILQKVLNSARLVRDGIYPYERDSVVFNKIEYAWPVIAILQQIALENNNQLTIIDFGGSLGSSYFQIKNWLKNITIKWIIVEQSHFVEIGKNEFENEELIFEFSLNDAMRHKPSTIFFSSVLQYIKTSKSLLEEVIDLCISNIIIDRTSVIEEASEDLFTLQVVPKEIYEASYPCRFFAEKNIKKIFSNQYHLIADFMSFCDPSFNKDGITYEWKGYYFKKN